MRGTKPPNNSSLLGSAEGRCTRSASHKASVMGLLGIVYSVKTSGMVSLEWLGFLIKCLFRESLLAKFLLHPKQVVLILCGVGG